MTRESSLPRWAPPVVALVAGVVLTWPSILRPTALLASPWGEGNNHYWMLWRAFQAKPVANVPEGIPIPLMDLVNLPLALPTIWLDPALAFNQVVWLNLALAFAGAWALARELSLSERAALTAGVAAMASPFLHGQIDFGLTESLPVGWLGLHGAALLAFGRTGRWTMALASGLCLAAFTLAGWYHAVFGLVAEVGLVAVTLRRSTLPWPKRIAGVLGQGVLAVALVLPAFWSFLEVRAYWEERWIAQSSYPPVLRQRWRSSPNHGADLLNFVLPEMGGKLNISQSVYLGLATLGLALAGDKRVRWLWWICAPLLVLGLGHWLGVGGHTRIGGRVWRLPAGYLVEWLPSLNGLSHWHRAVGPASLLLAVGAAGGVERLSGRLRWLWVVAPLVIVGDSIVFAQTRYPRQTVDTATPTVLQELPGAGAIVELPFDNGRQDFSDQVPRRSNLFQPRHGHPVAENYEGPDSLLFQNQLIAAADGLCGAPQTQRRSWYPPAHLRDPELARMVQGRDVEALRALGFSHVLLERGRCPQESSATAFLEEVLGPPTRRESDYLVWALSD